MDSLTQAALGAAIGEAVLGKKIGRKAAILGAIGGTIPDLDVFIGRLLYQNEIQARDNGEASILYLQQNGGDVYIGNAIVQTSDKRLKRDIENLSYGLSDILKLRPTEYFWKGKIQKYKSLGLIAQEVEEIIKNVVTYNQEQDKYGMSYTELIPILIKAIQEQNKIIEAQSLDNNNLKAKAKSFEERLSALEGLSKINN